MSDANAAITLLEKWPVKNTGSERDSNPRPLRYRCNALPTELSKPHESGRVWVRPYMFSGRNTQLKYMNSMVTVIDVQQLQLNNERMKDANAAITLLETWPEKCKCLHKGRGFKSCSSPGFESRSEPVIFSGHFSSCVMAAFASFILSLFHCYCWTSITKEFIYLSRVLRPLNI